MHIIQNTIVRAITAIVLGAILLFYPSMAMTYLVITIGILFIAAGVVSVVHYFVVHKRLQEHRIKDSFPIEGVGSLLFGLWLVITPAFFANVFMYILGVLLLLAGISQIMLLTSVRKRAAVAAWYYVMPVVITLLGIAVLAFPFKAAAGTLILVGVTAILYGVIELINWFSFRKAFDKKRIDTF